MKKIGIFIFYFLLMQVGIAQDIDNKILEKTHHRKIDSLLQHYKKKINVENPHYAIYYKDSTTVYGYENSLINIDTSRIDAVRIMTIKEAQTFFGKNITDTALIEIQYITFKNDCSTTPTKATSTQATDNNSGIKKRKKLRKRTPVSTYYDIKVNFIGYEDVGDGETVDEPFFYSYLRKRMNVKILAHDEQVSGKVLLHFILEQDALVSDVQLGSNSPVKHRSLVQEAIRLLKKGSGCWQPYGQEKNRIRSYHAVIFDFRLVYESK